MPNIYSKQKQVIQRNNAFGNVPKMILPEENITAIYTIMDTKCKDVHECFPLLFYFIPLHVM